MLKKLLIGFYSLVYLFFKKVFYFKRIRFTLINNLYPSSSIEFTNGAGTISISRLTLYPGSCIRSSGGHILIRKNVFINRNCSIISRKSIIIGSGTSIGPNTVIIDHDHDYKQPEKGRYISSSITIGSNVWIGAGVIILRGSSIGDGTVIAAGSIIKGDIPAHSIVIQKRVTTILDYTNNSGVNTYDNPSS